VLSREPERNPALERLTETCLRYLEEGQRPTGRFTNRRSAAGVWGDLDDSDDANGRALYGLGCAVRAGGPRAERALALVERASGFDSPAPRANAWAAIGAASVLAARPGNVAARMLLERASGRLGDPRDEAAWPWPEARLAYDNARLPEARIAAGIELERPELIAEGLRLLSWLAEIEHPADRFSFAPTGGWTLGEPKPAFDQQPLEAAATADACAVAYAATGEERWRELALDAVAWFLGRNDHDLSLLDPATGGTCDGLTADGRNENQGAESTLAGLAALQRARELQSPARSARSSSSVDTLAAPIQRSAAP
jgi:hypothetical protein